MNDPREPVLPNGLTRTQLRRLFLVSILHYTYCIVTFVLFFMAFASLMANDSDTMDSFFTRGCWALVGSIASGIFRHYMLPKEDDRLY